MVWVVDCRRDRADSGFVANFSGGGVDVAVPEIRDLQLTVDPLLRFGVRVQVPIRPLSDFDCMFKMRKRSQV